MLVSRSLPECAAVTYGESAIRFIDSALRATNDAHAGAATRAAVFATRTAARYALRYLYPNGASC
jgi:hypothetical protein